MIKSLARETLTMSQTINLRVLPRTVQQETVDTLRQAIFSGHFEPGSRLVESQLCTQLGISRPSLREALRSLAAERLIDLVPNRGPSVPILTWEEVTAIYEVREMLEVDAVGRCSQRISKDQLQELEKSLSAFEDAASSNDSVARITTTEVFYSIILANCGNPILEEIHRGLVARISLFRSRSMSLKGRAISSLAEMKAIYEAIASGDEKAARNASRRHILNAMAAAKKAMETAS
ncbi:GntR family transcriptional regulator [Roseovarius sp. S4756]|uniref:GntR family transcriptional regulator n=1 Tax=Roseovarius maritimus TaxID=3342637 RepID=UPI00372C0F95